MFFQTISRTLIESFPIQIACYFSSQVIKTQKADQVRNCIPCELIVFFYFFIDTTNWHAAFQQLTLKIIWVHSWGFGGGFCHRELGCHYNCDGNSISNLPLNPKDREEVLKAKMMQTSNKKISCFGWFSFSSVPTLIHYFSSIWPWHPIWTNTTVLKNALSCPVLEYQIKISIWYHLLFLRYGPKRDLTHVCLCSASLRHGTSTTGAERRKSRKRRPGTAKIRDKRPKLMYSLSEACRHRWVA